MSDDAVTPGPVPVRCRSAADLTGRLAAIRKEGKLTLRAVARRTGTGRAHLGQWERGNVVPNLDSVARWVSALGYDLVLVPRRCAACKRVGLHTCGGEWRNHDRAEVVGGE